MSWVSLLGVVFIVLKLLGIIHWSWVWVTLPLWFGWAVLAISIVLAIFITKKRPGGRY